MKFREADKILRQNGWSLRRVKGSHYHYLSASFSVSSQGAAGSALCSCEAPCQTADRKWDEPFGAFQGAIPLSEKNLKRQVVLRFRVTPEEQEIIQKKMALLGTENQSAYLRKMALDGMIINIDLPELKEILSLLRYAGNNLNQLTRRAHETGRVYDADLQEINANQKRIVSLIMDVINELIKLR